MSSSCTQAWEYPSNEVTTCELSFTCHTDGSFDTYSINTSEGLVFMALTIPDADTPPTPLYDIAILDEDGVDIFGGELENRSATAKEQAVPAIGSTFGGRYFSGILQLAISGNSVNGGKGKVKLYILNNINDSRR